MSDVKRNHAIIQNARIALGNWLQLSASRFYDR